MIWKLLVGVVLCFMHVTKASDCVFEGDLEIPAEALTNGKLLVLRDIAQKYVCKYGKIKRGVCEVKEACKLERETLVKNLTKCAEMYDPRFMDNQQMEDMVMLWVAKARRYFWKTALSDNPKFRGALGNARLDRISLFVPSKYRAIVEEYERNTPEYNFPMTTCPHIKDMIVKILEKACDDQYDDTKFNAVRQAIDSPRTIVEATAIFLTGYSTGNLMRRSQFDNLFTNADDPTKLQKSWDAVLKPLPSDDKKDTFLEDECAMPIMYTMRDTMITFGLRTFFINLQANMPHNAILNSMSCGGGAPVNSFSSHSSSSHQVMSMNAPQDPSSQFDIQAPQQPMSQHVVIHHGQWQ